MGSILAQSFQDFEIVLVDNNPSELRVSRHLGSMSWLTDRRVRLIEDEKPNNASAVRNLGLSVAQGEWITFLDDDDAYRHTKLETQLLAARAHELPLGTCGTVLHLPGRRRVRCLDMDYISGDELLLCFFGMPTIFHRRAPEIRFNERLDAGEDVYYFQSLLHHFQVNRTFNVSQPLVDVHQQPQHHVNLNARGVWQACEMTLRDFGCNYSQAACSEFRARARLRFCMLEEGHFLEMITIASNLARRHGVRSVRTILNSLLYQVPWLRRWLVH